MPGVFWFPLFGDNVALDFNGVVIEGEAEEVGFDDVLEGAVLRDDV